MTPKAVQLTIEGFKERLEADVKMQQQNAWLTGIYVMHAIGCTFGKGNKYPKSPLENDNHEPIGEENEILAAEEFRAYALALQRQGLAET